MAVDAVDAASNVGGATEIVGPTYSFSFQINPLYAQLDRFIG